MQKQLDEAGITVLGGQEAVKEIGNLKQAPSPKHEYGNRTLTMEIVRSLDEAVDHIHSFGSGHTEAIITGELACMHPAKITITGELTSTHFAEFTVTGELASMHHAEAIITGELTGMHYAVLTMPHITWPLVTAWDCTR